MSDPSSQQTLREDSPLGHPQLRSKLKRKLQLGGVNKRTSMARWILKAVQNCLRKNYEHGQRRDPPL